MPTPERINDDAAWAVTVSEPVVDYVRRRLLSAPGVQAWLEAVPDQGAGLEAVRYWFILGLVSRGLDGFFLPYELDVFCSGRRSFPAMPHHSIARQGATRRRRPAQKTIDLAVAALVARFGSGPNGGESLLDELRTLTATSTVADQLGEADTLTAAELHAPGYRPGQRARAARARVRRLHEWGRSGAVAPGESWQRSTHA